MLAQNSDLNRKPKFVKVKFIKRIDDFTCKKIMRANWRLWVRIEFKPIKGESLSSYRSDRGN